MNTTREENGRNMEKLKSVKAFELVMSLLMAICLGLSTWCLYTLVTHGEVLAGLKVTVAKNTQRLDIIEARGSPTMEAHEKEQKALEAAQAERIAKLESSMSSIQVSIASLQRDFGRQDVKLDMLLQAIKDNKHP